MSKGSRPRPYSVSQEEFANNFDRIFGGKVKFKEMSEQERNEAESVYFDDNKVNLNIDFVTVSPDEPENNVKDSTQGG